MAITILGYTFGRQVNDKNLNTFPAKVSVQRIRQDIATWRAAITEAEQEYYPFRVKMQTLFVDTALNGHVTACVEKRKNLTLLRELKFDDNEQMEQMFKTQWFQDMINYCLDAIFYGYTLVGLGDIVNSSFPNLISCKRWYISPDRYNIASYMYNVYGANFNEDPYKNWHIWCDTPSENGQSTCGYGLFYKVAMYEILCRNLIGFNSDAAEVYGMPIRWGKTNKTEESERSEFLSALVNMASNASVVTDLNDEIELIQNNAGSTGYKIFEDLEKRCEAKISKVLLGHADALDSTPGKLGSEQNGAATKALEEIASKDGRYIESIINGQILPKLKDLGFNIPNGVAKFANDTELEELRTRVDASNKVTADIALTMSQAGLKMDAKYFEERTGIPTIDAPQTPIPTKEPLSTKIKNKLDELYR